MEAKTITMYNEAQSLAAEDRFFVSKKTESDNQFESRSVSYETIANGIASAACDLVSSVYGFGAMTSLSDQVLDPLSSLMSSDMVIDGAKTFIKTPLVDDPAQDDVDTIPENGVVTKKAMSRIVADEQAYIGGGSVVGCHPRNAEGYTYDYTMLWRIAAGTNDSSMYRNENGIQAGSVTCDADGVLVCYGWLADQGNTTPENCWVAMYGKVENVIDEQGHRQSDWVALQVQPWILGQNSQTAQYVGFTVPVKRGLELKIKTGFRVNGGPTGFGEGDSLMLASGSSINMFVGYIIH